MDFEKVKSKKAKSGYTWRVRFAYTNDIGMKKRYSKSGFTTKKEAQRHGEEMQRELEKTGGRSIKDRTVNDVWLEWLEVNEDEKAPGTIRKYKLFAKNFELRNRSIKDITMFDLQRFFNSRKQYSRQYNHDWKAWLSNIFKYARKQGYITQNPLLDVDFTGKEKKSEPPALTLEEIERMCEELNHYKGRKYSGQLFQNILYIGYYTGLRISEILALEWSDFDFENMTISVTKKMEYLDGPVYSTERMKTKASRAILPMCQPLADYLEPQKADPMELVISENGNSPHRSRTEKVLKRYANQCDIEDFHPHRLRHAFTTNVVRSGNDPKTASMLARHSNIQTTLNIYTQMDQEDLRRAIDQTYKTSCPDFAPN